MSLVKFISSKLFLSPIRTGSKSIWAKKFKSPYMAKETFVQNYRITTVYKEKYIKKHIFLMHGGAYTMEPVVFHANIVRNLADCGFIVSIIDYPLAPENTAEKTISVTMEGFKLLTQQYPDHEFIFFGDSAGGGLALSLLMHLRDEDFPKRPAKTMLFSPWLDITMSFEQQKNFEKSDKVLDRNVLRKIGSIYAGTKETTHWSVSPIYGNINDLGKFLVFYSDTEVLSTDSSRFLELAKQASGTTTNGYTEHKAGHDYIMIPKKDKITLYYSMIKDFILKE